MDAAMIMGMIITLQIIGIQIMTMAHNTLKFTSTAVSYTQLDVYKRQGPKCANCRLLTLQNVNSISQMVTCLLQHGKVCTPVIAPNGGIKLGESALCPEVSNTVSYTHLDVYKRQSFRCAYLGILSLWRRK